MLRNMLLAKLAALAADSDTARANTRDAAKACLHEGAAAAYKQAADLLTTVIAQLAHAHGQSVDAGYRAGLAHAIRLLGGSL